MHTSLPHSDRTQLPFVDLRTLESLDCSLEEVLTVVSRAFTALRTHASDNPAKTVVEPSDGHSVAYSMVGRDAFTQTVGFKVAYEFDPLRRRGVYQNHSLLFLCDDRTGQPLGLVDVRFVDALRTAAATALLARVAAHDQTRVALLVGTGLVGRRVLPLLVTALPQLERLMVYGRHEPGLRQVLAEFARHYPERSIEVVADLEASARQADIVVGATGAGAAHAVRHSWLRSGAVSVLLGYGIEPVALHRADYRIATDAGQMRVTGSDMGDANQVLPEIDAELPDLLLGTKKGRRTTSDRVFAYNSGMVVTDIALGRLLVERALKGGQLPELPLW